VILIYPEKQTAVAASSQDANFPAANLLDSKPAKVWRAAAGVNEATLTLSVASGAKYLGLFGTNAESAVVVVKNGAGAIQSTDNIALTQAGRTTFNRFWLEYTQLEEAHSILITLTAAAGVAVYAGVARAGAGVVLDNPDEGLQEGRQDYSIVHELSSGAIYTRKRMIVRTFAGKVLTERESELYLLSDIYDYFGPHPLALLVAEGFDDRQWSCFGRFEKPPPSAHETGELSTASFSIVEAV
jgi:hypothetical protein